MMLESYEHNLRNLLSVIKMYIILNVVCISIRSMFHVPVNIKLNIN